MSKLLRKKTILTLILCLIASMSIMTVTAAFPYALTTEDLPEGFELVSTLLDTDLHISQTWKTPSDSTGMTSLSVENAGSVSNASAVIDALSLFGSTSVSVSGADEAKKVSILMLTTIYAREDKYILISAALASTEADVITLLEAQVTKISGKSSAPGFILLSSIAAISVFSIILNRYRPDH